MVPPLQVQLGRGRHATPGDHGCLMELASVLAGETWSDHPATVHPVVAAVARVVNDWISEQDRARLQQLVPAMIGTATDDIESYARLALICSTTALNAERVRSHPEIRAEVQSAQRMARGALSAPTGAFVTRILASAPMPQRWYRRTAVRQVALSAAAMAGPTPSDRVALCELLRACVLALRREPEVPRGAHSARLRLAIARRSAAGPVSCLPAAQTASSLLLRSTSVTPTARNVPAASSGATASELSTAGPMPAATADLIAVADDSSATGGTRPRPAWARIASSK